MYLWVVGRLPVQRSTIAKISFALAQESINYRVDWWVFDFPIETISRFYNAMFFPVWIRTHADISFFFLRAVPVNPCIWTERSWFIVNRRTSRSKFRDKVTTNASQFQLAWAPDRFVSSAVFFRDLYLHRYEMVRKIVSRGLVKTFVKYFLDSLNFIPSCC